MTTYEVAEMRQAIIMDPRVITGSILEIEGNDVRNVHECGLIVMIKDRRHLIPWHRVLSVSTYGQDDLLQEL